VCGCTPGRVDLCGQFQSGIESFTWPPTEGNHYIGGSVSKKLLTKFSAPTDKTWVYRVKRH
jgi:hypothetical protein